MSLYLDPDHDEARKGPIFDIPDHLEAGSEIMHAAALVIDRYGILLRGTTGSGKSLLQRHLRQEAQKRGLFSALVSDDYVRLAKAPVGEVGGGCLMAFAPLATQGLQEVRGFGVTEVAEEHRLSSAVMHLLIDLTDPDQVVRMPGPGDIRMDCLGVQIDHLSTPQRRAVAASDLVFARLSTWKAGG